jgi:hypothetical protein
VGTCPRPGLLLLLLLLLLKFLLCGFVDFQSRWLNVD